YCTSIITNNLGTVTITATNGCWPIIIDQPADQTTCAGSSATFSVGVTNVAVTYQWYASPNVVLTDETNDTLELDDVDVSQAGGYFVVLTSSCGSVTSSVANLTVLTVPVITAPVTNVVVCAGSIAVLSVEAAGGNLSYEWYFQGDWIEIG